ncbi:NADH-quinone oxidoreductase subunit L [Ectobacillus sp. JY-23]|uniref:NADH-quinone oxidoreductase subunit L n=1 Tax=Ectobacillus sp. JY-23 TaxID=2933872 RepID=UPI001FF2F982|nr:NADH-quinone oxidoreductase subunit L [Ectobacillus sp. JY-23]UOY94536.1 NADH-quinone oxidoreductase subunit L [Ectobacillus sp. JY-23]
MMSYAWLIPVFPLVSFLILLFGRLRERSGLIGSLFMLASLVGAVAVLVERLTEPTLYKEWTWLVIGERTITMGFKVTALNALMLVIVTLVSFLVHVYANGYMKGDARISVFYAYLGLFTFAMLGLVLSPNLLQLYIFWELVGLGSFLLIGFYYFKPEARAAAKKAFIMTRIGDVGLFIGIILLFWQAGSFEYEAIFTALSEGAVPDSMITLTAILIFIGAVGKSGQFPLHTWLPDAMEGPTPVSALIHAATMVAAGVYLVAAMFPLFEASEAAMMTVAITGGFTAVFAASIGLVQTDIKRILAFSTVSQLGYMMLALGSGGYVAAIFHLTTHAFFKALLFLAAGSVIHAVHTQDITKMGGLYRQMKVTGTLFLIGAMAISGVPLLSGFFSKDEILLAAWQNGNYVLFTLGMLAAALTAFYMFRLYFLVFTGKAQRTGHESPGVMTLPMMVLGALAVLAGYLNTPWFGTFLGDWLEGDVLLSKHGHGPAWIMIMATVLSLGGIAVAYVMYKGPRTEQERSMFYIILQNKYYVDEFYALTVLPLINILAKLMQVIERVVEGIAQGIRGIVSGSGGLGARLQSGQVQTYGAVVFVTLAALLVIVVGGYFS